MIYITDEEITSLGIDERQYYEWVKDMIISKKSAILPAKISMKMEGHIFYNVMPCILPDKNVAGVKLVNRYPDNTPSLKSNLMLYDLKSGDLKAVMDANLITTLRTGAVAAHSIFLFARDGFQVMSLIGLGNVTKAAFKIFSKMYGNKPLTIKVFKYKDHADKLIREYADYDNYDFVVCDTYEQTMRDSDVIVSGITFAEGDFCDEKVYKKGCLIVPIHTLGFQNCDLTFDKVFGDDYSHIAGFKYFDKFKSFNEVCDVQNGLVKGRENDQERILAYNIGIAVHDVYFAEKIYELIVEKGAK